MKLDQSFALALALAITTGLHPASGTHEQSDATSATAQYEKGTS